MAKHAPPAATYGVGSIVRISLENFLTYANVTFECGPRFNFVLGPNGSGKSSLVSAICLGLGGKPEILSRSPSLSGFVRHGCTVGTIQITLQCERDQVMIQRVLNAENDRSDWSMNGVDCTMREVRELVDHLNIHVENLCNFLPQERVHAFAKLSPNEILVETMRTVGGEGMVKSYKDLIALRLEEKTVTARVDEEKAEVAVLEQRNGSIEKEVERFQEREQILKRIGVMEKKRPWLEYEEAYDKMKLAKKTLQTANNALKDAQQNQAPLREALQTTRQKSAAFERQMTSLKADSKSFNEKFRIFKDKVEAAEVKVDEERESVLALKATAAKKRQTINSLQKQLADVRERLNNPPNMDLTDILAEQTEKQSQLRQTVREKTILTESRDDLMREHNQFTEQIRRKEEELNRLNDIKNRRAEKLGHWNPDCYSAMQWVRNNRNRFRMHVFDPVCLEVSIRDMRHADAVESLIAMRVQVCFVTQCSEDYDLLMHECCDKMKLRVNAVNFSHKQLDDFKSRYSKEQLQGLGFDGLAMDFVECPGPVMLALLAECGLHNTPIAAKPVDDQCVQKSVSRYIAGGVQFVCKQSRYGSREMSVRSSKIRRAMNLTNSLADPEELETLKREHNELQNRLAFVSQQLQKYDGQLSALAERERQLTGEKDEISRRKRAVQDQITAFQKLSNKEETLASRLATIISEDSAELETRTKQQLVTACISRGKIVIDMQDTMRKYQQYCDKVRMVTLERNEVNLAVAALEQELQRQERDNRDAKLASERAATEYQYSKEIAKRLHRQAESGGQVTDELLSEFNKYPGNLAELDVEIARDRAKADLSVDTDPEILREFTRRQKQIKAHQRSLDTSAAQLGKLQASMKQIRDAWETQLDSLIAKLSAQFSAFFAKLNCVGEVGVNKEQDFDKWGVEIMVKFRDKDDLMLLSSHRQSGGEKAVSIISYLMSLQYQSVAPFRVVDEINQGMDPRNERAVHAIMVDTVCNAAEDSVTRGQYFLITPKLLPDLMYHRDMRVLVVFNGDFLTENWEKSADGPRLVRSC